MFNYIMLYIIYFWTNPDRSVGKFPIPCGHWSVHEADARRFSHVQIPLFLCMVGELQQTPEQTLTAQPEQKKSTGPAWLSKAFVGWVGSLPKNAQSEASYLFHKSSSQ